MNHDLKFYTKRLLPLVGGKITAIINDGSEFFGIEVKKSNEIFDVWLLQDDEGNGHGSFEIKRRVLQSQ